MRPRRRSSRAAGFSLLELLITMLIIFIVAAMTVPMMRAALLRAHIASVAMEAKKLHTAFRQHYLDEDMYPNASGAGAFDLASFEPLVTMGYYDASVKPKLLAQAADGYDSPDDAGTNQEFWLEMTLMYDPTVRFLVADSNDSLLGAGDHYDGIYLFRDGVLTPIGSVKE